MREVTTHAEQLVGLKKIEGQVKGIQRMIKEKRYCVDIITQIRSIIGALYKVENNIFRKHIDGCVVKALKGSSVSEKEKKIDEIISLIQRFRRSP